MHGKIQSPVGGGASGEECSGNPAGRVSFSQDPPFFDTVSSTISALVGREALRERAILTRTGDILAETVASDLRRNTALPAPLLPAQFRESGRTGSNFGSVIPAELRELDDYRWDMEQAK